MQSAGAYINKVRVVTIAKNTKVEYPGGVGKNQGLLYPTIACNPNFTRNVYFVGCRYYKGVTCTNPIPYNN